MPEAISMATRRSIISCYQKGKGVSALARQFGVSRGSIYSFINSYKEQGEQGLMTSYENCGRPRRCASDFVYRAVRCMRTWHPGWGAEKIRAELLKMRPALNVPHYRTLNRWFHWNNQIDVPIRSKLPGSASSYATYLHEGWQVDAKEGLTTADGKKNCWLNITDEYSGTVIDPVVFPHKED